MRERKVKIAGWGNTLSGKKIEFDGTVWIKMKPY